MTAFLALLRKDLVQYFSNRRALIMSIAAPIVIAAFFGYLFGGNGGAKPSAIDIAVTDLDQSALTKKIVASLKGESMLAVRELRDDEAQALVRQGKLTAALVLPAGFGEQASLAFFSPGNKPEIALRYDPSKAMALAVVRGMLAQTVMRAVGESLFSLDNPLMSQQLKQWRGDVASAATLAPEVRRDLGAMFDSIEKVQQRQATTAAATQPARKGPSFDLPFTTREEEASSRPEVKYNSYAHSFAGMSVQFILFTGIDLGIGLLLMRRMGLWQRLRAAPISKSLLIGSRVASGALIAFILTLIIFAAAILGFGVRIEGSVIGFLGVAMAFSVMTASFGLLIASVGRTPEATRGLAIFVTLILVMLGGAWAPTFIFPQWLQTASLAAPTRWAVDGFDAMTWRGLSMEAAMMPIAVMLAVSAVCGVIAARRFAWQE
jgi:ABC-2 type transport system permease protein